MVLMQTVRKSLTKLNGAETIFYYLVLNDLVFENIQKKYTDFSVKIDINKNIESLNISNSAAIVFHHINQYKNKT